MWLGQTDGLRSEQHVRWAQSVSMLSDKRMPGRFQLSVGLRKDRCGSYGGKGEERKGW